MIRHTLIAFILATAPFAGAQERKPAVPAKAKEAAEKVKDKVTEAKEKASAAKEKAEPKRAEPKKTDAAATDAEDKALLDHAAKELKKLTPTQTKKLLDLLNDGKPADLQQMPGIGEAKAEAVKKARPFKSADQLIMVDGVGEATFDGIVKWTKDGMASADASSKEKEAPKKGEKKAEPKKEKEAAPKK
jgi:DNA uptake protein ComE-like DNA-binding protein